MKRFFYSNLVLTAGLLSTQLIATIQVYLSNQDLLKTSEAIARSGYLSVPNSQVAQHLDTLPTAMAGGFFFTVSIGAGLTLLTLVGVWLWRQVFNSSRKVALFLGGLWFAGLVLVNINGWDLFATAYLVIVPVATGICANTLFSDTDLKLTVSGVLCPILAAMVLSASWCTVLDKNLFSNIRDNLLLSNRMGESITSAYYLYTLYPAEAFKSLSQKQIRTCRLGDTITGYQRSKLEKVLRIRDYLPVKKGTPVDLTIEQQSKENVFFLKHHQQVVLRCSQRDFFLNPGKTLKSFSKKLDHQTLFRKITLIGLLIGFPLVLFTLSFNLLKLLPGTFLSPGLSNITTGLLCIGIGIALLFPVYQGQRAMASGSYSVKDLNSSSTAVRLAILKKACANHRDISSEARKHGVADSPNIAERYWFVRNLVYSNHRETSNELLRRTDDPAPIVACQAFWAMGQRKDRSVIPDLVKRIEASSHWYLQMYGYRALKALGWVQPQLPQNF